MSRNEEMKIGLINEFQISLGEISRLLTSGDTSEAEHWVYHVRRTYAAKVYEIIERMGAHNESQS